MKVNSRILLMPMVVTRIDADSVRILDAEGRTFTMREGQSMVLKGNSLTEAEIKEVVADAIREEFAKLQMEVGWR